MRQAAGEFRPDGAPDLAAPLPEAVDVAVIGGGVVGVAAALYAARAGLRAVVLEKGRIAGEQSSRNWGWIRVQGRDRAEIPVAQEAQRLWTDLDAQAGGRMGLRQVGVTYLARSPADMARHAAWLEMAAPYGVSTRLLDRAQMRDLMGSPRAGWIGALHTPTDLKAEPWVAVREMARLAEAEGVRVIEGCAVRALDRAGGRVAGVVTELGRIRAEQVVLAGGAWSALFLRRHGIDIPQLSVRCTALATGPLPQVLGTAAVDDSLAMRPRADGGYTLAPAAFAELFLGPDVLRHLGRYLPLALSGEFDTHPRRPAPRHYPDAFGTPRFWSAGEVSPFERMRVLNPTPSPRKVGELVRRFGQVYPQAGRIEVRVAWAGMIDVLPDVLPVVDRVDALPGLVVATGMCGHGFGTGPAYGRIVADLLRGRDPGQDIGRFRMARFFDGSRLRPGPTL